MDRFIYLGRRLATYYCNNTALAQQVGIDRRWTSNLQSTIRLKRPIPPYYLDYVLLLEITP